MAKCQAISMLDFMQTYMNTSTKESLFNLKIIQLLNSLGLFVLPAFAFAFLFSKKPMNYLRLNNYPLVRNVLLTIMSFLFFLPLINLTVEWNKGLSLPESLGWLEEVMRQSENAAEKLTKAFLQMDNLSELWFNVLLIGIIPAVGEELIFRGILQRIINKNNNNYHIGIWVSAILFSAIHFQFFGFVPRMLLGAFFGYIFAWTNNLWVPILAHFVNNTAALLIAYNFGGQSIEKDIEQYGATSDTLIFTIISSVLFLMCLWKIKKGSETKS